MHLLGHYTQLLFVASNLYLGAQVMQSSVVTPIIGVGSLLVHPVKNVLHLYGNSLHPSSYSQADSPAYILYVAQFTQIASYTVSLSYLAYAIKYPSSHEVHIFPSLLQVLQFKSVH